MPPYPSLPIYVHYRLLTPQNTTHAFHNLHDLHDLHDEPHESPTTKITLKPSESPKTCMSTKWLVFATGEILAGATLANHGGVKKI